jgi:hypothetical protein
VERRERKTLQQGRKEEKKARRKGRDLTTMMKRILNARISSLLSLFIYIHFEN